MALRAKNSLSLSTTAMSNLVGLPVYWHEANTTPTTDWDKWVDLFQVAVMAKFSISITELTRELTEQNQRVRTLLGDMDEDTANKKVVSVMYLPFTWGSRKETIQGQISTYNPMVPKGEGTHATNHGLLSS